MEIPRLPTRVVDALMCSKFRDPRRYSVGFEKTKVIWNFEFLKNFDQNAQQTFIGSHPLNTLFKSNGLYYEDLDYTNLKIYRVNKLKGEFIIYTPACKYLLLVQNYFCDCGCNSCDGATDSEVTLAPMSLDYALDNEYLLLDASVKLLQEILQTQPAVPLVNEIESSASSDYEEELWPMD